MRLQLLWVLFYWWPCVANQGDGSTNICDKKFGSPSRKTSGIEYSGFHRDYVADGFCSEENDFILKGNETTNVTTKLEKKDGTWTIKVNGNDIEFSVAVLNATGVAGTMTEGIRRISKYEVVCYVCKDGEHRTTYDELKKVVCRDEERCWFETYDEAVLNTPLLEKGPLNHTECRDTCLTFTVQGRECVALSIYNGVCHLFMSTLRITTRPEMTSNSSSMTDIKRCYAYSVSTNKSSTRNRTLQNISSQLPPPSEVTQFETTTVMPGCSKTTKKKTTTTTTSTTTAIASTTTTIPKSTERPTATSATITNTTDTTTPRKMTESATTMYKGEKSSDASFTARSHSSAVDTTSIHDSSAPNDMTTTRDASSTSDTTNTHSSSSPTDMTTTRDASSTSDVTTNKGVNAPFGMTTASYDVITATTTLPPIGFDSRGREIRTKCICRCRDPKATPSNQTEALKKAIVRKKGLIYKTNNLTKMVSKKISREDQRRSSQSIGVMAIVMVSLPLAAIVLPDLAQPLRLCFGNWTKRRNHMKVEDVQENKPSTA